jgi:hypothetical protein
MSYNEISQMMEVYSYKPYYDEVAGVNYMVYVLYQIPLISEHQTNADSFDNDQWVSFDDERSIMQKVKFANDQGYVNVSVKSGPYYFTSCRVTPAKETHITGC